MSDSAAAVSFSLFSLVLVHVAAQQ